MTESPHTTEAPVPPFWPKPEIWELCKSLGEKHELTPFKVLERLVQIGVVIAKVEEEGVKVYATTGKLQKEVIVFCGNGNGHQPPTP